MADPVYLVVLCADGAEVRAEVEKRVAEAYENHQKIAPWAWMVSTGHTTKAISDRLFPADDTTDDRPRHIVLATSGAYFGYHARDLWEWVDNPELERAVDDESEEDS